MVEDSQPGPTTLLEAIRHYSDLDIATKEFAALRLLNDPFCPYCESKENYYAPSRRIWCSNHEPGDLGRFRRVVRGCAGKRLTYKEPDPENDMTEALIKQPSTIADEITKAFAPLIGLRLSLSRYSGLTNFQFGEVRRVEDGTVGQFALHIQCPWRIVTLDRIVTGSPDHWYPADENLDWTEWDKDPSIPSLQEKRILEVFQGYDPTTKSYENRTEKLIVEAVDADRYGGVQIQMSGGYLLQLFPAGTSDFHASEHWRLFQPGSDAEHFVVNTHGVLERIGPDSEDETE
jgi:hypothetical protein